MPPVRSLQPAPQALIQPSPIPERLAASSKPRRVALLFALTLLALASTLAGPQSADTPLPNAPAAVSHITDAGNITHDPAHCGD